MIPMLPNPALQRTPSPSLIYIEILVLFARRNY